MSMGGMLTGGRRGRSGFPAGGGVPRRVALLGGAERIERETPVVPAGREEEVVERIRHRDGEPPRLEVT